MGRVTICFFIITNILISAQALDYSGGTGEPNNPYQITTAQELIDLGNTPGDYDKNFILTADIDISGQVFSQAVIGWGTNGFSGFQGTAFTGVFDGQGYCIRNLQISGRDYLGLFGMIGIEAKISNLGLDAVNVSGSGDYIGGLVGYNYGTISNCYSNGVNTVTGRSSCNVGGLVGHNAGTVSNCYSNSVSTATGSTASGVGGLVGYNSGGISSCSSDGDSTATGSMSFDVGGLTGQNSGTIYNCYSTGTAAANNSIGGFAGSNFGNISNCYSTGAASGDDYVGGLVGFNNASLSNCYSTGVVSGTLSFGGLICSNFGSVSNCFWDTQTSGLSVSSGGTDLTTAQMQDINNFLNAGWDFIQETDNGTCNFWHIQTGAYPTLATFAGIIPIKPSGSGTLNDPYLITDVNELSTVWYRPADCYCLDASLNLSGMTWTTAVIPWFNGTFDANEFVISNLHIRGGGHLGLFGQIGRDAIISNLGLDAVDVSGSGDYNGGLAGYNCGNVFDCYNTSATTGNDFVGGLIGYNNYGGVSGCYSLSTVTGADDYIGGLAGYNNYGNISDCNSTSTTTGHDFVGGLAGYNNYGVISDCNSASTVTGNGSVGGLSGYNFYGDIFNCHSFCTVTGADEYIGGLTGRHYGNISYCRSLSTVTGTNDYTGGLVGGNNGNVSNSYSNGTTKGIDYVGGLVGYSSKFSDISNCYSSGTTSGNNNIGGLIGYDNKDKVSNCYSTSKASGNYYIGGLSGVNYYGSISNCYSTGRVTGNYSLGGLMGYNYDPASISNCFWDKQTSGRTSSHNGGTGKTTTQMKTISTYTNAGWDFVNETANGTEDIWVLTGSDYPHLFWE